MKNALLSFLFASESVKFIPIKFHSFSRQIFLKIQHSANTYGISIFPAFMIFWNVFILFDSNFRENIGKRSSSIENKKMASASPNGLFVFPSKCQLYLSAEDRNLKIRENFTAKKHTILPQK